MLVGFDPHVDRHVDCQGKVPPNCGRTHVDGHVVMSPQTEQVAYAT